VTAAGKVAAEPAAATGTVRGPGRRKIDDRELLGRFPPRAVPAAWPVTLMGRDQVWGHLIAAPSAKTCSAPERARRRGMAIVLGWLEDQPGGTWQDRWLAAGAEADPAGDWRLLPLAWNLHGSEGKPRRVQLVWSEEAGKAPSVYWPCVVPGWSLWCSRSRWKRHYAVSRITC
jgi:hypothetical protein